MKKTLLPFLALLSVAPALRAQSPHFGLALNLAFPTAEFRSRSYAPTEEVTVRQVEGL